MSDDLTKLRLRVARALNVPMYYEEECDGERYYYYAEGERIHKPLPDYPADLGAFQLFQDTLCVPFDVFHRCIEITLGRPVWTHEFADMQRLRDEYLGKRPTATMADILKALEDRGITPIVAEI